MKINVLSESKMGAASRTADMQNLKGIKEVIAGRNNRKTNLSSNINNKTGGSQYGKKQRVV